MIPFFVGEIVSMLFSALARRLYVHHRICHANRLNLEPGEMEIVTGGGKLLVVIDLR